MYSRKLIVSIFLLLFILINLIEGQTENPFSKEEIEVASGRFSLHQKNEPYSKLAFTLIISVRCQKLFLMNGAEILKEFPISTAKNGVGCEENSYKTPFGMHRVIEKFGEFGPIAAIYKDRKFTGEYATIITEKIDVPTDVITSRILWLDGLEEKNKNSKARYIYIHGTHEEGLLGSKASRGCIRMSNADIIELFDYLPENTLVDIVAD